MFRDQGTYIAKRGVKCSTMEFKEEKENLWCIQEKVENEIKALW